MTTNEPLHTKGKWVICYDGQIDGNDGKTKVCSLPFSSYKEYNDSSEIKANARLIASAPTMQSKLSQIHDICHKALKLNIVEGKEVDLKTIIGHIAELTELNTDK